MQLKVCIGMMLNGVMGVDSPGVLKFSSVASLLGILFPVGALQRLMTYAEGSMEAQRPAPCGCLGAEGDHACHGAGEIQAKDGWARRGRLDRGRHLPDGLLHD